MSDSAKTFLTEYVAAPVVFLAFYVAPIIWAIGELPCPCGAKP